VISGISGISKGLSTRSITETLKAFGAGSNSVEGDRGLFVPALQRIHGRVVRAYRNAFDF
jgi:hypothetical protein